MAIKDLTGQKFNKLTVVGFAERRVSGKYFKYLWHCVCDCGGTNIVDRSNLKSGSVSSCGCNQWQEKESAMCRVPEYAVWRSMLQRCSGSNNLSKNSKRYTELGITISEEWKNSFHSFLKDMGSKPSKEYTIERVNNSCGYSKDNCIWATQKTQANNRSTNLRLTYEGVTKTLSEWSDLYNLRSNTLRARIFVYGWDIHKALHEPIRGTK